MVEYGQSMDMPSIPTMSDITDIFANFGNNWFHMREVLFLLFGILFAFFVARKIMKRIKGEDDDD